MTNPATTDRRDVAHSTNPIGGHEMVEKDVKTNLAEPLDKDAAKMPPAGSEAQISGVPQGAKPGEMQSDAYGGLPHGVPPARSGQAAKDTDPAAPDKDNPGRMAPRSDGGDAADAQSPRKIGQ